MRFAFVATSLVAAVAVPFAVAATGPQMSSEEFLSAVRCTAYVNATEVNADLGAEKLRLNAEALHQPRETAALARAEAHAIAQEAAVGEIDRATARACADQQLVTGAPSQNAV
ncbi:MAG: hypothetical protein R3C16_02375 [Hyphomonadaceae bacterium]